MLLLCNYFVKVLAMAIIDCNEGKNLSIYLDIAKDN